jgi:ubiquinone/menaquinone biosynthesis C-methylase UbiE
MSVSFDRAAENYDASRERFWQAEQVGEAIAHWLPPGEMVVEVGVGTALIATQLWSRGCRVVGFDLSPAMLQRATRRLPGRVAVADAQRLPVRTGSVGAVCAVHVLHVVSQPSAVLDEAARILRPHGRLVVVGTGDREPDDDAGRLLAELQQRLIGPRADRAGRVIAAAEAAGLTLQGRQSFQQAARSAPSELAHQLENRMWSWTWNVDAATWAALVEPVAAALRALPEPDSPREMTHERTLLAFAAEHPR